MIRVDTAGIGNLARPFFPDGIESAAMSGTSAGALNRAAYRSGVTARPAPGAAKGLSDWDRPDLPK